MADPQPAGPRKKISPFKRLRTENAKWRTKFRDAQAEIDALKAQLASLSAPSLEAAIDTLASCGDPYAPALAEYARGMLAQMRGERPRDNLGYAGD